MITQPIHVVKTMRRKRILLHPLHMPGLFLFSVPRASHLAGLETHLAPLWWWSVLWCLPPALCLSLHPWDLCRLGPKTCPHWGKPPCSLCLAFISVPSPSEGKSQTPTHPCTHTINASKRKKIKISHLKSFFPLFFFLLLFGLSGRVFYIPVQVSLLIYKTLSF